jgi:predicted Zn-dependent protease
LLLQEAGRSEEALAAIEGFEADPDLRHDHAYVAAQVLVAAGLFARAAAAIEVGLASYPGRASYLSVAAMIAFARGEFRDALALAERAVDAAPYNGHHHQTYSWILLNSGESEMARRHLAATLRHIDDFSVLWYQSSLACEAVGDKLGASDAIVQALMLDSGEATFRKQAMKVWRN